MENCRPSSPKRLKLSRESLVTCFENSSAAQNILLTSAAVPDFNTSQKVHLTPQSFLQETETVSDKYVTPEDIIYSSFKFGNVLQEEFIKENLTLSIAPSDMELCVMSSEHWNPEKNLSQEIESKEQDFLSDVHMPYLFEIGHDTENTRERANIVSDKVSIQDEIKTQRGLSEAGYIATSEVKSFRTTHIFSSLERVTRREDSTLKHDFLSGVTAGFQERQGGSDDDLHDVHQHTKCESDFMVRPWSNSHRKPVFLIKDNTLSPATDKEKYEVQCKANGAVLDADPKEDGSICRTETKVEKNRTAEMVAVKYGPLQIYDAMLRNYLEASKVKNEDLQFILREVLWTNAFSTADEHLLEYAECLTRKQFGTDSQRSLMYIETITEPCICRESDRKAQNENNVPDSLFLEGCSGKIVEKRYSNDFASSLSRSKNHCKHVLCTSTAKFSEEKQIRTKVRAMHNDTNLSSLSTVIPSMSNKDNLDCLPFVQRHATTNSDFPLSLLGSATTGTQKKKILNLQKIWWLDIMYGEVQTAKQHINKEVRKVRQPVEQCYCFRNVIKHNHNSTTDTFYPKATICVANEFYCIARANVKVGFIYTHRESLKQFFRKLASQRSLINTNSLFNVSILNKYRLPYTALHMETKEISTLGLSLNKFQNSVGIKSASAAWDDGLGDRNVSKWQRSPQARAPEVLPGSKWLIESMPTISKGEGRLQILHQIIASGGDLGSVLTLVSNTAVHERSLREENDHSGCCREIDVQSTGPFTYDSVTAFLNIQEASKVEVKCSSLISQSHSGTVTTVPWRCCSTTDQLKEITDMPSMQNLHVDNSNISLVECEFKDFTFIDKSVLHRTSDEEKSSKGAKEEKSLNNDICDITTGAQIASICFSETVTKQNIKEGEKSEGTFYAKSQLNIITDAHGSLEQPEGDICILKSAHNVLPTFEIKQKFKLEELLKDQAWKTPAYEEHEKGESQELPDSAARSPVQTLKESAGKRFDVKGLQKPAFDQGDMEREQEVPMECDRSVTEAEDSLYSVTKQKGFQCQDAVDGGKAWVPAFTFLPSINAHRENLPEQLRKLEPLKTCSRPIRVGLSKKARVKQLHRSIK